MKAAKYVSANIFNYRPEKFDPIQIASIWLVRPPDDIDTGVLEVNSMPNIPHFTQATPVLDIHDVYKILYNKSYNQS